MGGYGYDDGPSGIIVVYAAMVLTGFLMGLAVGALVL